MLGDFKAGRLKGFTFGGGWRWRSANVIGSDSKGSEITGQEIAAVDGPVIPVQGLPSADLVNGTADYNLDGLIEERAVSINTTAAGGNAKRVDETAQAGIDGDTPAFDRARTRMAFVRNGDIFERDLRSGARLVAVT